MIVLCFEIFVASVSTDNFFRNNVSEIIFLEIYFWNFVIEIMFYVPCGKNMPLPIDKILISKYLIYNYVPTKIFSQIAHHALSTNAKWICHKKINNGALEQYLLVSNTAMHCDKIIFWLFTKIILAHFNKLYKPILYFL